MTSDADGSAGREQAGVHEPVLLDALMGRLEYGPGATVVDATVGQAGHASALAGRLGAAGRLIGLDVDEKGLAAAQEKLEGSACGVELVRENFGRLEGVLARLGVGPVDVILADLGVSSGQLADPGYGISFQVDGPLDMRLDDRLATTAGDLVNGLKQEELANVIYRYGEERRSRAIARAIAAARREKRIERTGELVEIILRALRIKGEGRRSKIHPATRTFQALRIAVNDELGQLEALLGAAGRVLKVGGQVAVISFHSLEDRIVKYAFREEKAAGLYEILTKKPIVAEEGERLRNRRSRSAKLRVARKIAEGGGDV